MALYKVAIQAIPEFQGAFYVYLVSFLPVAKVGFCQCFGNGGNFVLCAFNRFYSKAHAIVGYALVGLQFRGNRAFYCKMNICAFMYYISYSSYGFYNAC